MMPPSFPKVPLNHVPQVIEPKHPAPNPIDANAKDATDTGRKEEESLPKMPRIIQLPNTPPLPMPKATANDATDTGSKEEIQPNMPRIKRITELKKKNPAPYLTDANANANAPANDVPNVLRGIEEKLPAPKRPRIEAASGRDLCADAAAPKTPEECLLTAQASGTDAVAQASTAKASGTDAVAQASTAKASGTDADAQASTAKASGADADAQFNTAKARCVDADALAKRAQADANRVHPSVNYYGQFYEEANSQPMTSDPGFDCKFEPKLVDTELLCTKCGCSEFKIVWYRTDGFKDRWPRFVCKCPGVWPGVPST